MVRNPNLKKSRDKKKKKNSATTIKSGSGKKRVGKTSKKSGNFKKSKAMRQQDLLIRDASYLKGYELSVTFNTGETKIVDFSKFIAENKYSFLNKYKQPRNFKAFKIEYGNLVWGKNWDLIFPIMEIYKGKISL